MKLQNGLCMQSSFIHKSLFGLTKAVASPRSSLSWILRGHLAKDELFVSQTYWFTGTLPRVPVTKILPCVEEVEITVHKPHAPLSHRFSDVTVAIRRKRR